MAHFLPIFGIVLAVMVSLPHAMADLVVVKPNTDPISLAPDLGPCSMNPVPFPVGPAHKLNEQPPSAAGKIYWSDPTGSSQFLAVEPIEKFTKLILRGASFAYPQAQFGYQFKISFGDQVEYLSLPNSDKAHSCHFTHSARKITAVEVADLGPATGGGD